MAQSRPFVSMDDIEQKATLHWATMQQNDYLEAFQGHPMIGDVNSLRAKYANTKEIASNEQSGTAVASEATLQALQQANHDYLNAHGFIFIICATGLSAQTMLNALQKRMNNTTADEINTAAQEQLKITLLRMHKAINPQDISYE